MYANDLEQQLLLLLDADHEITEGSSEYPPSTTLAGELVAFVYNGNVI